MMDKIWKRIDKKRPRGKKLFKLLGIISGLIWISAVGVYFTLKNKNLPQAILEIAGAKNDTLNIHAIGVDPHSSGAPQGESQHHAQTEEIHGGVESVPNEHTGDSHSTLAETHPVEANSHEKAAPAQDLPSRTEWEALKQLVELNANNKAYDKALIPLQKVMLLPTRDPDLLALATTVYLGTAQYHPALQAAEQGLHLRPEDMNLKAQSIEAAYRLGHVENAIAQAQAAVKEHPKEMVLLLQLATMEVELGPGYKNYGKALSQALELDPEDNAALYLSGRKAQLEGNYADALAIFKNIMQSEPKRPKLHAQMGMALYHLGKNGEAEWEFEIELALNNFDYNTWYNLGELHLSNSEQESSPESIQAMRAKAMECFLKAVELKPEHAQAHYRIGVLLNGNGQYKEALRHLQMAHQWDARHVPTLIQLSVAYENLRQTEKARQVLTKAYELDPLNKVVLFKLKPWS